MLQVMAEPRDEGRLLKLSWPAIKRGRSNTGGRQKKRKKTKGDEGDCQEGREVLLLRRGK